ncbi:MAG TPA: FAD-dependent oxidoreductase, partial [Bryobacteraceae bacterium]|nr:FAD-dependent oxidoreductase [Bryobacteraceae bacterium]
ARNGVRAALIEPSQHVGGMVSGGLSHSDIGDSTVIGGISREFFERVGRHYGKPVQWNLEPKVAEAAFRELLQEAKVPVFYGHRLKEKGGVVMEQRRVRRILTENGASFCAAVFADTSYEGDLIGQAGVSYTWGRESTKDYGEPLAGVRGRQRKDHHFNVRVSPFAPDGSLLPEVFAGPKGNLGDGDRRVQAYTFRMCLSDQPENRVAFPKPPGYDRRRYELLQRLIDALAADHGHPPGIRELMIISPLPNHKFDINSFGGFSIDHIGASWDYPTANYPRRAEIWQDHRAYEAGFFYYLANDPKVPAELRHAVNAYGLAKDEFTDNQNWPYQLYVRESRRMIGEYVMTQKDIQDEITKPDSIGMGSYQSDSHHVVRVATPDGAVENEGEMYVPVKPYEIPYRILLPKREQASNLLSPVSFSATHVTYSTVRMEPQYMILGQASGTAAALAIRSHKSVHDIDVNRLRQMLVDQKAILAYPKK